MYGRLLVARRRPMAAPTSAGCRHCIVFGRVASILQHAHLLFQILELSAQCVHIGDKFFSAIENTLCTQVIRCRFSLALIRPSPETPSFAPVTAMANLVFVIKGGAFSHQFFNCGNGSCHNVFLFRKHKFVFQIRKKLTAQESTNLFHIRFRD